MIPSNIDECMVELTKLLDPKDQIEFFKMKEEELYKTHHALGQWIRNNWKLWENDSVLFNYMKQLGFIHPDDMSSAIIHEYWRKLHNLPSKIKEDVEIYKEFWDKNKH